MTKQQMMEDALEDQRKLSEKLQLQMSISLKGMPSVEGSPELMDEFRAIGDSVRAYLFEERMGNQIIFDPRHKF